MVSTTQTPSEIKSQEFVGHIKQLFRTTSLLTSGNQYFVNCCIKGWVHRDLRPDNMLLGRLNLYHLHGGTLRQTLTGSAWAVPNPMDTHCASHLYDVQVTCSICKSLVRCASHLYDVQVTCTMCKSLVRCASHLYDVQVTCKMCKSLVRCASHL